MKIITLCGSLKFQKEMMTIAEKMALEGYCILTPVYPVSENIERTEEQLIKLKETHFKRIEFSDTILVVNVNNYIGDSTNLEQGNNAITEPNYNYKNSIAENFTITKDMPEIDFSSWENLGNDYYALRLTDHSEYKKLIDYYGVRKLTNIDFENIFATIIVRKNTENSFSAEEVTVDANGVNLNIKTGGLLDVTEEFKYPAMLVYTPNYMNLTETNLRISVDK